MKRLVVALLIAGCLNNPATAAEPPIVEAVVYTKKGEIPLQLELANTPPAREKGLMQRATIPQDGMLFLFPVASDHHFWMKNTSLPLDIIFISPAHTIAHIEHNVEPYSLEHRSSGKLINSVIELDAGRAVKDGIAVGDKLRYELPASIAVY
jgi:uncharacterized membrane protein (UPF0127 family)